MSGQPSVAPHVLAARLDSAGDALLAGPAIRAISARAEKVTALCGRRGLDAMRLLPGIDDIISWTAPWIDPEPEPVSPRLTAWLVEQVAKRQVDEAVIFTSFHQSPLPLALLLRLAGVRKLSAISEDFAGSLLDVRHHFKSGAPEAERALSLAAAAGFPLPEDDDGRLAVRSDLPDVTGIVAEQRPYIVVHPGASAPARAWPAEHCAALVQMLSAQGWLAVVTGSESERALTGFVAGADGLDLGGRVSFAELAQVIRGADVIVVGNTGPAHLAAAVGTPVVSLFAPTVPASAWRPYRVPHIVLGNQSAPCRDTRARTCPIAGHPCLRGVTPDEVMAAAHSLAQISGRDRRPSLAMAGQAMTGHRAGDGGAL